MKLNTASGTRLEIEWLAGGDVEVNAIFLPKTYNSYEEALHDRSARFYEALMAAKKAGVFGNGSKVYTPGINASSAYDNLAGNPEVNFARGIQGKGELKKGQTTKRVNGEAHKGKNNKGKSRATAINGVPPENEKVIKTPAGGYIMIPDKATVELFGMDKIQTMAGVNIIGDPAGARAFTVNGKRYIAGFDNQGKFLGYFLSTDMKTKFAPDQVIYQNKVDDSFINKLLEITYNLGYDPDKLMAVIAHETGGTFSPTIAYKKKVLKKWVKEKMLKSKSHIFLWL